MFVFSFALSRTLLFIIWLMKQRFTLTLLVFLLFNNNNNLTLPYSSICKLLKFGMTFCSLVSTNAHFGPQRKFCDLKCFLSIFISVDPGKYDSSFYDPLKTLGLSEQLWENTEYRWGFNIQELEIFAVSHHTSTFPFQLGSECWEFLCALSVMME